MPVREHDMEQGTPEWFRARAGKATASNFSLIVTPSKLKLSKGVGIQKYAARCAGERLVGGPLKMDDSGEDGWRGRGSFLEANARLWYEMYKGTDVREVGFVETADGTAGCSPDGLVDNDPEGPGGVEIKSPATETHVYNMLDLNDIATATQVQGSMWVTGREWWDVLSWSEEPRLGPMLVRVYKADPIQRILDDALGKFEAMVGKALDRLTILGVDGRVGGSELKLQLLASLSHECEPNPDNLSIDEISAFSDDVRRAKRAGVLDDETADSFVAGAVSGDPTVTRQHWESLKASMVGV